MNVRYDFQWICFVFSRFLCVAWKWSVYTQIINPLLFGWSNVFLHFYLILGPFNKSTKSSYWTKIEFTIYLNYTISSFFAHIKNSFVHSVQNWFSLFPNVFKRKKLKTKSESFLERNELFFSSFLSRLGF